MNAMQQLTAAQGCAADGTMAAKNPVAKFMDSMLEQQGPMRGMGQQPTAGAMPAMAAAQMQSVEAGLAAGRAMAAMPPGMPPGAMMHAGGPGPGAALEPFYNSKSS